MDNNEGTLLAKKKPKIKFTDEEIVLILRAYIAHPTSWTDIIADVKANCDRLPDTGRHLYRTVTHKQLRDRMSTQLSSLMAKDKETVNNEQIRDLFQAIRNMERRLVAQPAPQPAPPIPQPVPAPAPMPAQANVQANVPIPAPIPGPAAPQDPVARDNIVAQMPPSSIESDGGAPAVQPPAGQKRGKKRRKQSLGQLVRENQLLYRKWMTKKVPKIMRELGISSSDDDSDDN